MLWKNNNILVPCYFHCVKRSCYLCSQLVTSSLEHAIREAITSLSLIFKARKQVYMIKVVYLKLHLLLIYTSTAILI